jgi:hypothetical protein
MAAWHKDNGLKSNFVSDMSRAIMDCAKLHTKSTQRVCHAISTALLGHITLWLWNRGTREHRTASVNLAFGFVTVARPGEMAAPKTCDTGTRRTLKIRSIAWDDPEEEGGPLRYWCNKLVSSKSDSTRRGRMQYRGNSFEDDLACPEGLDVARGLAYLLRLRFGTLAEARKHRNAYLFAPYLNNKAMTTKQLQRYLHQALRGLGHATEGFTLGSLRKGAATTLVLNGVTETDLKSFCGWNSVAYLHYLRDVKEWQLRTQRALFQAVAPPTQLRAAPEDCRRKRKKKPAAHPLLPPMSTLARRKTHNATAMNKVIAERGKRGRRQRPVQQDEAPARIEVAAPKPNKRRRGRGRGAISARPARRQQAPRRQQPGHTTPRKTRPAVAPRRRTTLPANFM